MKWGHWQRVSVLGVAFAAWALSALRGEAQSGTNRMDNLAGLQVAFTNAWQRYDDDYAKVAAAWPDDYARLLESLRKAKQTAGDLDGVLAVKKEIDRFALDPHLSPEALVTSPPELRALQSRCADYSNKLRLQRSRKRADLFADYLKRLNAMQRNLTVAGKLEEAVAVNSEIKRIEALPELAEVRAAVAAASAEISGGQDTKRADSGRTGVRPPVARQGPSSTATSAGPAWVLGTWHFFQTDNRTWLLDLEATSADGGYEFRLSRWNKDIYEKGMHLSFPRGRLMSKLTYDRDRNQLRGRQYRIEDGSYFDDIVLALDDRENLVIRGEKRHEIDGQAYRRRPGVVRQARTEDGAVHVR
jgi:hypothetical protein